MKNKALLFLIVFLCSISFLSVVTVAPIIDKLIDDKVLNTETTPPQEELDELQSRLDDDVYYYYNNLSTELKKAYEIMYTSFMSFEDTFYMDIEKSQVGEVFTAVIYDNPHIHWIDYDYTYAAYEKSVSFHPKYIHSEDEAMEITEELNKKVDEIVSSVDSLSSDYEKELYFHDYICENTVYDLSTYDTDGHTAYSALLDGKSICEGYSRAMQMLLNECDIDNYLVVGDTLSDGKAEAHMWNIVTLDDDNYHLDVTWNDTDDEDVVSYFYFNLTDEQISNDHINIEPKDNNCTVIEYNYFVMDGVYVEQYSGYKDCVKDTVEILSSGKNTVEFVFESESDYKTALKHLEDDVGFFNYVYSAVTKSGRNLEKYEVEYFYIDDFNYIAVIFIDK